MKFFSQPTLVVAFAFTITMLATSLAQAAGGGGGGAPSQSAPAIDIVEKYNQGIEHLQARRYKKAQRAFRKVLSVSRKDPNSNFFLGIAYYAEGKVKKARKPFERAAKYKKNNAEALGYLGAVYTELGKQEKANEQVNKLQALKATCQQCRHENDINTALKRIEQSAIKSPQASLPHRLALPHAATSFTQGDQAYLAAVEEINRGNYLQALESLAQSAQVFGPHPDVLTYQGFANRKLGNHEKALHYYQQALAIDTNHRGANEYLGEYYVEVGDLDSARQQLAKLDSICNFGCEEAEELRRWIHSAES